MIRILLTGLLILVSAEAAAQSAKGIGSARYESRLDESTRMEALRRAQLAALETHVAEGSSARVRLFDQRRSEFGQRPERFITRTVMLSEKTDKRAKTYTVIIRAEINEALLTAQINAGSATAKTAPANRSMLTFVFLSRMQASSTSFDPTRVLTTGTQVGATVADDYAEESSEGEQIGRSSVATDGKRSTVRTISTETNTEISQGGRTTRTADEVVWRVASANEVNSVMTGVFSNAGYEVAEAEYVEGDSGGMLSVGRIRDEFSSGNDLSSELLRSTVDGVRHAGIPLIAYGTLDVGMQDKDPISGNVRIAVTVTGKVLNVSGRFPRTVSSVGPVQFFGLGPDAGIARTNALAQAAEQAATQMVDELNVKNVQ